MRALIAFILLTATAGTATADPLATVGVGPNGVAGPDDDYYVAASVGDAEGPGGASPQDDCNADAPARVGYLVGNPPNPFTLHSITPYTPTCVSTALVGCTPPGCPLYASYNTTEGRYYGDAEVPDGPPSPDNRRIKHIVWSGAGAGGGSRAVGARHLALEDVESPKSGKVGVAVHTDCEDCPPVCC